MQSVDCYGKFYKMYPASRGPSISPPWKIEGSLLAGYVLFYFLSLLIFIFPLFLGMVMNANEYETKEI